MVDVEYRAAAAAMARYDEKVKKLERGNNLGFIAGKAVEEKRQWEQFDRMTDPSKRSSQAVENPAGYAQRQRDMVDAVVNVLATICHVAMSEDAYDPDAVNVKVGSK